MEKESLSFVFSDTRRAPVRALLSAVALSLLALGSLPALADSKPDPADHPGTRVSLSVTLPLVVGWYDGKEVLYLQTEASDLAVAQSQRVNYVPRLVNAIPSSASSPSSLDDIYVVSGFSQANIIPSAPQPAGPGNTDPNYSPLWQVSVVTWAAGAAPHVLKSEGEVFAARDQGLVTIEKTNIVVNCPVIYTPAGGTLPGASIHVDSRR